jgi:hypothetical protein
MTLGQVRALCAGLQDLERADAARRVHEMRLAVHADAADIDKYLDDLEPALEGPDQTDLFLAQYQGTADGTDSIA